MVMYGGCELVEYRVSTRSDRMSLLSCLYVDMLSQPPSNTLALGLQNITVHSQ